MKNIPWSSSACRKGGFDGLNFGICLFQHLLHGFHGAFGRNFGIFGVLNPVEKSYKVKWLFLAGPTRRE